MAYQVGETVTLPFSSAATNTRTVDLSGLSVLADDYVLIGVHCNNTTQTLSETSGGSTTWDTTGKLNVSSGGRMWLTWAKVAAGPTISNPTFALSGAGTGIWQVYYKVYRDADATTFKDALIATDHGNVATGAATTGAMTPSTDNCTIEYMAACVTGVGISPMRFLSDKVVGHVIQTTDISSFGTIIAGTVQQGTAAATAQTFYSVNTQRQGSIVLAIRNKTNGKIAKDARAAMTKVAWYGDFGAKVEPAITWAQLSTMVSWTGGTIAGITVDSAVPTASTLTGFSPTWGSFSTLSINTTTASLWSGGWYSLPAAVDMRGKLFSLEWFFQNLGPNIGAEGAIVCFSDASGNAVVYRLAPKIAMEAGVRYTAIIAVETGTSIHTEGTGNPWAAVTKIGIGYHRSGSSATARTIGFRNALLHGITSMTGGSAANPLDIRFLDKVLNGWGYGGLCDRLGDSTLVKTSVAFGDGSTPTYVDATATMCNFPDDYSTSTQPHWNVPSNTVGLSINGASGDTYNITAATISGASQQNFSISAPADITSSFAGTAIIGLAPTLDTDVPITGLTFNRCGEVAGVGADLTNVTVSATTSTDAAYSVTADGALITSTTFDVTGTSAAYHLELGTAVTAITLADVTFSGTPGTDKVHVLKTTGTVTITISGTTSLAAGDVTSAGATVDIIAPQLYQTVTVTNLVAGSRVQIYDTTSSTELANEVAAGTSVVWTDADPAVASRAIRVRIAYVSGVTAKHFVEQSIGTCGVTEGTEAVTYLANQTDDDVYVTNAINGSTVAGVTFTDAATDLVNVNVPGGTISWGQIYAATAYWLFGAVGITNDIAMIDAPDPANYRFSSMKVKNTASGPVVPLTITGGYGYDATSGSIADVIDTSAGSIFPMPDHVVSKVVTVSGVNVITGDIADIPTASENASALLTAAQSAPIYADLRKINGNAGIVGSGTEADPWGPA